MPADYMVRLVEAFTDLLRREGRTSLTDGEMAHRIGLRVGRVVTSQVAGRWVAGKVKPGDDAAKKAFADVLGVQASWLYWNEGEKSPAPTSGTLTEAEREDAIARSTARRATRGLPSIAEEEAAKKRKPDAARAAGEGPRRPKRRSSGR